MFITNVKVQNNKHFIQLTRFYSTKTVLWHILSSIPKSGQQCTIITNVDNENPRGLGIWGERLFIFGELGSTGNYFRGAGEQAHNLGDLGSSAQK